MSRQKYLKYIYNWTECDQWCEIFAQNTDSNFGGKLFETQVPERTSSEWSHANFDAFRESVFANITTKPTLKTEKRSNNNTAVVVKGYSYLCRQKIGIDRHHYYVSPIAYHESGNRPSTAM